MYLLAGHGMEEASPTWGFLHASELIPATAQQTEEH
jgi:hypothetical protein